MEIVSIPRGGKRKYGKGMYRPQLWKSQVWKTQVQVERLENVGTARTANANLVYNSRRIYKQPGSWLLGSTLHVSSRGAKNSMNTPVYC